MVANMSTCISKEFYWLSNAQIISDKAQSSRLETCKFFQKSMPKNHIQD